MKERLIYFLICTFLIVGICNYVGNNIENNDIYSYVAVNIFGFLCGVYLSFKIKYKEWAAIFGVIVFLFFGIFIGGVLYIQQKSINAELSFFLSFLSTVFISAASATFSNYRK